MLDHFMRCVRKDMTGRGFAEIGVSIPPVADAFALVFAPAPVDWRGPFVGLPVCITGLELLQNNTPAAMANLARKRCAEVAHAHLDRELIYRPDKAA